MKTEAWLSEFLPLSSSPGASREKVWGSFPINCLCLQWCVPTVHRSLLLYIPVMPIFSQPLINKEGKYIRVLTLLLLYFHFLVPLPWDYMRKLPVYGNLICGMLWTRSPFFSVYKALGAIFSFHYPIGVLISAKAAKAQGRNESWCWQCSQCRWALFSASWVSVPIDHWEFEVLARGHTGTTMELAFYPGNLASETVFCHSMLPYCAPKHKVNIHVFSKTAAFLENAFRHHPFWTMPSRLFFSVCIYLFLLCIT